MVNEVLRLLRVYNDMKASELAEQLDLSSSYVSELETGKKKVTLEVIDKYGKYFDIPSSSILLMAESLDKNPVDLKHKITMALVSVLQTLEKNATTQAI